MELPAQVKDFRNFLYICWKHLNLPAPTPVQFDIANYIQAKQKRIIVEAFRGVGKSWITSCFVCHQLLLNPQIKILVISASKQRADDFSTFTLRLIEEMPLLAHLIPSDKQRKSKVAFDVSSALASHAPSVKSLGITSNITGSRANLVIADDVENVHNSMTQGQRDKLSNLVKEFDACITPENGRIIYLGTPQTENSLYDVLPQRGFKKRIWTARYPSEKQFKAYGKDLAPIISLAFERDKDLIGQPTDPTRFDFEDLAEREASYGRSGFNLQFQLDTRLADQDRYPLKVSDLIVTSCNPDTAPEKLIWASNPEQRINDLPCVALTGDAYYYPMQIQGDYLDYTGAVMAIDPSGKGDNETSYAVVKFLNGNLYLTKCGGLRGGFTDYVLQKLATIAKEQKVKLILCESNFGQDMFQELLKPHLKRIYPCTVESVRHSTQKEVRILSVLEPVLNQHRLVVDHACIKEDYESTQAYPPEQALRRQLMYQLTRLTKDKGSLSYDDRVDVLSFAVNYWIEQMARDSDQATYDRKQDLLRDELENFMNTSVTRSKHQKSWLTI